MFLVCCFNLVVLCYATLCSVVTACFEDMTPVTHLHPERVTDCVPVSQLFAPSLPALIVPALRSLSHSLTLRSLLTLPCFRWELVGRTLPPPGTNYQPPTGQHLASHLLFTCDHLFPLTTENLFWFSMTPLSTFCVHELVGLVWSGLVWSVC